MSDLTPAEEFIWKWRNEQLSGFRWSLLNTIQQADIHNLEKLRLGFPDEVEGWVSYKWITGWWDEVEQKGGRNADRISGKEV